MGSQRIRHDWASTHNFWQDSMGSTADLLCSETSVDIAHGNGPKDKKQMKKHLLRKICKHQQECWKSGVFGPRWLPPLQIAAATTPGPCLMATRQKALGGVKFQHYSYFPQMHSTEAKSQKFQIRGEKHPYTNPHSWNVDSTIGMVHWEYWCHKFLCPGS